MSRIDEVEYEAPLADGTGTAKVKIVPLQFLKAVLPNPQDLGENYEGETSIGCRIRGIGKDGKQHTYYVYNNGVFNVEEFDPDPFMEQLNKQGLPWHEIHDGDLEL